MVIVGDGADGAAFLSLIASNWCAPHIDARLHCVVLLRAQDIDAFLIKIHQSFTSASDSEGDNQ